MSDKSHKPKHHATRDHRDAPKWDYIVETITFGEDRVHLQERLNRLGDQHFELVSLYNGVMIFKAPRWIT